MITIPLGFGGEILEATFLARPNRFIVEATLQGEVVRAHMADRGRLLSILVPGARLLLARNGRPSRKTQFQAVAAYRSGPEARLASLDTHLPNRLIGAALGAGALARFAGYRNVRREVTIGASRFDFFLGDGEQGCVLEVKSAGDIAGDLALFPDAPTERGRRHLHELADLARHGRRAALVFVAQGEAAAVTVNRAIDPAFAEALRMVAGAGVEVTAYACPLTPEGITLGPEVPVLL